jgi:S-adenosylmethionine:tRNA-ribosyltransferase-isomerase (queuine synthetase)
MFDDADEVPTKPARRKLVGLRTDEVSRHKVRLVTIGRRSDDRVAVTSFAELPAALCAGDLVVVNDAATLPASLHGETERGEHVVCVGKAKAITCAVVAVAGKHN